jgi:hypothetical protein
MRPWTDVTRALAAALLATLATASAPADAQSDAQVRQMLIRASIASYPGPCPCPYNTDRAGRSCGRRSAYSRPGGYAPKCYPADVTTTEVREYPARR